MNLRPITTVLDRAASDGHAVTVWWRDDDAVAATPQLDRLFAIARRVQASLAIAAIPARIEPSLAARLQDEPGSRLLVHGLNHLNHAEHGQRPAEFGDDRPLSALEGDARDALARARAAAGSLVLPVFVPPWNRLSPALAAALPRLGYAGLSTFGASALIPGLAVVNTHLDPVDWRGSRSALSPEALAAALERALTFPEPVPVGLLTHHVMFDEPLWGLTNDLTELLAAHPAVRFASPAGLWATKGVIELRSSDDLT
jgi:hypothetical protein